jgi:hypothetical protein
MDAGSDPKPAAKRGVAAFARLTALLLLVALAASRVGLVLHELGGHYGVARAFGCGLRELRLFAFGGGYVDTDCGRLTPARQLATDLGGIGVELVLGALLCALARRRRDGLAGLLLAAFGLLFVLHGLFYLVTGIHYGVGDGRALHQLLAARRRPLVAAGSAALLLLCFGFARGLARRLARLLLQGGTHGRTAALGAAVLLAAGAHGALMESEQAWVADASYAAVFRPESERRIEGLMRRFEAERPRAPEELAAKRRALEARLAVFPLTPVLGAGIALAALAGFATALRRGAPEANGSPGDSLGAAALVCALSIALVLALDRLL